MSRLLLRFLPLLGMSLSGCIFTSQYTAENELAGDGLSTAPMDSLDVETALAIDTSGTKELWRSSISGHRHWVGPGLDQGVEHGAFLRFDASDSGWVFWDAPAESTYLRLQADTLASQPDLSNLKVRWVLTKLMPYGTALTSAQNDTLYALFTKDSAFTEFAKHTWEATPPSTYEAKVTRSGAYWQVSLDSALIAAIKDAKGSRLALDLKLGSDKLFSFREMSDSSLAPRLVAGSLIQRASRVLQWTSAPRSLFMASFGDTLFFRQSADFLRKPLQEKKQWNGVDQGVLLHRAWCTLQGLGVARSDASVRTPLRALTRIDSSIYDNGAWAIEPVMDSTAFLKNGVVSAPRLWIGSGLVRSLSQAKRQDSVKMNIVVDRSRLDSVVKSELYPASVRLPSELKLQWHLVYSPYTGTLVTLEGK